MQVPNLLWQTKLPLPVGPSLPLSGLETWAALADNATWMQLVGKGRTGQLKGLLAQSAAPQTLGTVLWRLPPRCGWRELESTPLNLSCSLLAKVTRPPEGTCNFTSFGGKASKFNGWALRAGQLLCLSPSLRALLYPLKCQPGLSLLTGVSKIAPLV